MGEGPATNSSGNSSKNTRETVNNGAANSSDYSAPGRDCIDRKK